MHAARDALQPAADRPEPPGPVELGPPGVAGRPREHLEFAIWYLASTKLIMRDDQSKLQITAAGVDYIEANHDRKSSIPQLRAAG